MTQKEKLIKAGQFAHTMRNIAYRIEAEGNDYDMSWHRSYVSEILHAADQLLEDLTGNGKANTRRRSKTTSRTKAH